MLNGHAGLFDSKEEKERIKKEQNPEIDYISLAAIMVKDGHLERALVQLENVDLNSETVDLPKYYTLKGLIWLKKVDYEKSKFNFEKSIYSGNKEPLVYVYLAQVHYALNDYKQTLAALKGAGELIYEMPDLLGVQAQCYWLTNQKPEALTVLLNADKLFPEKPDFMARIITYYIELGLYEETISYSKNYLKRFSELPMSYLIVGEALRKSKQFEKAVQVLEQGHKMFPTHENLLISLAHSYMQSKRYKSAARLFEKATVFNKKYLKESVGLYRLSNDIWKARYMNAQVNNTKQKLKQWVEILLTEEKYEEVVAITSRLEKYKLLKDDKLRYAVAYSFFKTTDYDKAEDLLKKVTDPKVFRNGLKLIKAIEVLRKREDSTI